jgi:hypothetical protein
VAQVPQSGKNATIFALIGLTVPNLSAKLLLFAGPKGRLVDFTVTGAYLLGGTR